ncbi:DUF4198 domain-containing protein [Sedimentitalea sp. CY04]|uniref:DUF4198 domain-containing protein n=2 Tax=Parasedimentitalea denitrificans TaxID=2211118 RepID=A0ABX0W5L9_9RHOB|nr:DUF4198 domain-containing protein [Sedimentitalea sp. CY04]
MFSTQPTLSHEFWIEPQKYQVETEEPVIADLRNGQNFSGANQVFFARRTKRFDFTQGKQTKAYRGRMGDLPAFQLDSAQAGLLIISHETAPETLTYDTWEEFQTFIDLKGFPNATQLHQARGLPKQGFSETYTRHAKSLVAVGNGKGEDTLLGMETEFVAGANPYTDDIRSGMPVTLYYLGNPRPYAQFEVFERHPSGHVRVFTQSTDTGGKAFIPVQPSHTYLLDAVVLRPAPETEEPVWETLWASLTFATPQ